MSIRLIEHGVNIITLDKNYQKMAMTCAWAMHVDYDKILCLIGSQSITGKNLEKNDYVGISVLNKGNKKLADYVGDCHSNSINKFANNDFVKYKDVYVVNKSSRYAKGKVIDIFHLEGIEADYLVYILLDEVIDNHNNDLLHMSDYE